MIEHVYVFHQTGKHTESVAMEGNRIVDMSFPFPSNGKAQRKEMSNFTKRAFSSFNSLQTGKHSERIEDAHNIIKGEYVSIPFKRESTAKGGKQWITNTAFLSFHSLQTGKHSESAPVYTSGTSYVFVSIPFKRESTAKAFKGRRPVPPNIVSIPFKRESTAKV